LLHRLGNTFPEEGQTILWEDYSFHLETVENHEIKMVKIKRVHFPEEREEQEEAEKRGTQMEIKAQ
jgi:CBS domain containing-hemolysin-like protein